MSNLEPAVHKPQESSRLQMTQRSQYFTDSVSIVRVPVTDKFSQGILIRMTQEINRNIARVAL